LSLTDGSRVQRSSGGATDRHQVAQQQRGLEFEAPLL
jgi:hypothetical protein